MTIYDIASKDGKNYIYSGDTKEEIKFIGMIFDRNSDAHNQFIKTATEQGSLVLSITNYPQAVDRMGEEIAQKHFTQLPELKHKEVIKYVLIGLGGLILLSMIFKK